MASSLSPLEVLRESPHLAYAGDTVDAEKWEVLRIMPVAVHIPEARDEKFSGGINYLGAFEWMNFSCFSDGCNAVTCNKHSHVCFIRAAGSIDDGGMSENKRRLTVGFLLPGARKEKQEGKNKK